MIQRSSPFELVQNYVCWWHSRSSHNFWSWMNHEGPSVSSSDQMYTVRTGVQGSTRLSLGQFLGYLLCVRSAHATNNFISTKSLPLNLFFFFWRKKKSNRSPGQIFLKKKKKKANRSPFLLFLEPKSLLFFSLSLSLLLLWDQMWFIKSIVVMLVPSIIHFQHLKS